MRLSLVHAAPETFQNQKPQTTFLSDILNSYIGISEGSYPCLKRVVFYLVKKIFKVTAFSCNVTLNACTFSVSFIQLSLIS